MMSKRTHIKSYFFIAIFVHVDYSGYDVMMYYKVHSELACVHAWHTCNTIHDYFSMLLYLVLELLLCVYVIVSWSKARKDQNEDYYYSTSI